MLHMLWPLALAVGANIVYNLSARNTPTSVNILASLTITYLLAATITFLGYVMQSGLRGFVGEVRDLTWTTFALGIAIVGIEMGYMYMYRAGWLLSTASMTSNIVLALLLLGLGVVAYGEGYSIQKLLGVVLCVVGVFLLNR